MLNALWSLAHTTADGDSNHTSCTRPARHSVVPRGLSPDYCKSYTRVSPLWEASFELSNEPTASCVDHGFDPSPTEVCAEQARFRNALHVPRHSIHAAGG